MKYLFAFALILSVFSSTSVLAQESKTMTIKTRKNVSPEDVLYIIRSNSAEEFPVEHASLKTIDSDWIEAVDVLKDTSAVERYGDKGANGVVIITLKEDEAAANEFLKKLKESK
ncbi:hypothetical protein [Pontibacter sp. SGAir0037]|uniref:hypothetical protein n=1 Tax=Pontibacter sp. SGAir0037 TaxID=2571030 RepID=UPI0010CD60EE|nr:hypothetical protein [Pontibacter sp. SGAir0037]QCR24596.1 hypothetical protein C1N53_21030 [Pontibacter sp. SGAir0037]